LKIHGSIDDESSIRATMRAVASRQLHAGPRRTLERLLRHPPVAPLVVLGYSASDAFDITPMLRDLATTDVPVIYVEHGTGHAMRAEPLSSLPEANPFRWFRGVRLFADTNRLIAKLRQALRLGDFRRRRATVAWSEDVQAWARGTPAPAKHLITARWLFQSSQAPSAVAYCERALRSLRRAPTSPLAAAALLLQGQALHLSGRYRPAIERWKKAVRHARGNPATLASAYEKLGGAHHNLGDYRAARSYYERALRIAERLRDPRLESLCHSGIGSVHYRMNRLAEAQAHYAKALSLARRAGFKTAAAAYALNLANVHAARGRRARARTLYADAIATAKLVGYRAAEITASIAWPSWICTRGGGM
jgi:tetratricopeptide (TPR) repeat protein